MTYIENRWDSTDDDEDCNYSHFRNWLWLQDDDMKMNIEENYSQLNNDTLADENNIREWMYSFCTVEFETTNKSIFVLDVRRQNKPVQCVNFVYKRMIDSVCDNEVLVNAVLVVVVVCLISYNYRRIMVLLM